MSKDPVRKTKDVRAAVDAELGFDPLVDAADITVRNIAGDVTLTGTVPSYPQYLEAAAATRRVAGVTGVHNNLMVVLPERDYRATTSSWPPRRTTRSRPTSPCRTAWRRPRRTATSS